MAAAITLADSEGLGAVSLRRIAAELGARTMSLYSHIVRKDDLLDLMADEILGEYLVPGELPADWREALRAIARQCRATGLRHPWIPELLASRPMIGPNGVRHAEQSVAAVESLPASNAAKRAILTAVDDYTLGRVQREITARELPRREGITDAQWRQSAIDHVRRLLDSGDYPHLARFGADGMLSPVDHERIFEAGLDMLLAGIGSTASVAGQ